MPSRGSTTHPGTRAGGPVRRGNKTFHRGPAKIRHPQARPQLVRTARRHRHKPVLYAMAATTGMGALTALLTGRWGAAFVLVGMAAGIGVTHLVWQHHQRRQALKPARPTRRERDPETGRKSPKARTLTAAQASAYGPGWKAGDRQCVTHQGAPSATCPTCRASGDHSKAKAEPSKAPPRAESNGHSGNGMVGHYAAAAKVAHGTR